jgi:hypothetical protein
MSMYKRPSQRVRCNYEYSHKVPPEGSFLYKLLNPPPTQHTVKIKQPVYHQDEYLKLLESNYKSLGLPFVDPGLPVVVPKVSPEPPKEPELVYGDRVQVNLRVLKSGIVRIKINSAIADVYSKYYKQGKRPPFKTILNAYKSHGFSKEYLERITKNNEKRKAFALKIEKVFAKIFDKEPVKKVKKKKKEEEIEEVDVEDEDKPPIPDEPEEEETLDVEPDEEEDVEEEEYVSDGE